LSPRSTGRRASVRSTSSARCCPARASNACSTWSPAPGTAPTRSARDTDCLEETSSPGELRDVGCELRFDVTEPSVLALQLAPATTSGSIVEERLEIRERRVREAWLPPPFRSSSRYVPEVGWEASSLWCRYSIPARRGSLQPQWFAHAYSAPRTRAVGASSTRPTFAARRVSKRVDREAVHADRRDGSRRHSM
jgi:hypothetical protein